MSPQLGPSTGAKRNCKGEISKNDLKKVTYGVSLSTLKIQKPRKGKVTILSCSIEKQHIVLCVSGNRTKCRELSLPRKHSDWTLWRPSNRTEHYSKLCLGFLWPGPNQAFLKNEGRVTDLVPVHKGGSWNPLPAVPSSLSILKANSCTAGADFPEGNTCVLLEAHLDVWIIGGTIHEIRKQMKVEVQSYRFKFG